MRPWFLALVLLLPGIARAAAGPDLIAALRQGGYVIVMRHASAPRTPPAQPDPANTADERQLDPAGRASARAMGAALYRLQIPIGEVDSSPTYRARETVALLGVGVPILVPQLGESGRMMSPPPAASGAWLKTQAATPPVPGTDRLLVTHMPNIMAAFPGVGPLQEGEALIFRPAPQGPILIGRIKMEEWAQLSILPPA